MRPPKLGEVDVTDAASLAKAITELKKQMKAAAKRLASEETAQIRDRVKELRAQQIYKTCPVGDEERHRRLLL